MSQPELRIVKLVPHAVLPQYMTEGSAGMDLCASDCCVLPPGGWHAVGTGLLVVIPDGFEGQVRPRSGLAARHGVTVLNAPGTIDADYRGELRVLLVNHGSEPFVVQPGERIAQLVICPVVRARLIEASSAPETPRGSGGFGSTGR